MSHFISTKPFFILEGVPNHLGFIYSANPVEKTVDTGSSYTLSEYDNEEELANAVDALVGEQGWYWTCENRIEWPTNPNKWHCRDLELSR